MRDCACRLPDEGGWLPCPESSPSVAELALIRRIRDGVYPEWEITPHGLRALEAARPRAVPALTGDICHTCGSPNMVRTGTCLTCTDCGDNSGGCS